MLLDSLVTHARQAEEQDAEQFGVENGREQSRGPLEVGKYPVHDAERSAHFVQPAKTEPIDVYRHK